MEPAMEPQENGESPFRFSPNRPTLANTRVLDNHYDPRVHEKPWIASGHLKDYKYEYSDSGLGYMMKKPHKMRNFKERHEQVQEIDDINKRNKGFRHFREYENVVNNEILITVEYCTNCKEHQGSTRHDEAKYATYANTLKREIITHYPIVKVVLKPLIFEQNDQATETLYLRSRIGAFEVQLFSKNSKGQINKQYIFSKLYSKNWPSISRVVEDVSKFLPTDDFVVRLIDPNYDPEETKQSETKLGYSQSKGQANKIKGLHVILRPLRTQKKAPNTLTELSTSSKVMNESSRFGPGGTSRPNSAAVRPQSAYSTTSSKSMLSNKKALKERDENFSATGTATQTNLAPPKEYVGQSDDFGIVLFKQIPHNMYEVELLETQNYLPDKKIVNIFDMVENNQMLREDIILQEQTMGFCRIKITDGGMPFGDASIIIAKKFPDKNSKTAVLREKDVGRGVFEFMIDPGEYVLSINKMGFGERKEEIIAVRGVNEFAFDMRQPPSYTQHPSHNEERVYERPISASRPEERPSSRQRPTSSKGRPPSSHGRPTSSNGRPDAAKLSSKGNLDVIQQENMEASPVKKGQKANTNEDIEEERGTKQKNERVKSALVKKVEFSIYDVDSERPVSGVQVILEEIGFRGITTEHGKCLVPINKLTQGKLILNHDAFFGMVEEYGGEDGIDLKNATEKKFYLISKPSDNNEVQLRFLPGRGVQCCQFSVLYNKEDDSNKKDVVVQHADGGKEIIILKNLLKKHGVFRIIAEIYDLNEFFHPESTFILSHYADCDPLYIFPPSESDLQGSRLIWDVGFFADPVTNPQFIEINGYSSTEITLYSYLREYQMLLNYLQNSKSDLKTLLGFKEKNRIEKDDDVFIPKETIYASLDKYGLEIKNVDHLLSSARGSDGLYSLRECERRFASLRPPFNFVKDQKGDSSSDNNYGSEEGEEEEYLYEDDN